MRLAALALVLALTGCKQHKHAPRKPAEEGPSLKSTLSAGDESARAQFVSGLYGVEDNGWRWTQRRFTIALGVPVGAAQKGAALSLKIFVPDVVIEKLRSVTLTASIDGKDLPPETYDHAGIYTYKRGIPAAQLPQREVTIAFRLDKAMPPTPPDVRELGVIVVEAALQSN